MSKDEKEYVKIYSLDDPHMLELGQVIKTMKSKNMFQILATKELHAKEIGKIIDNEDNPRLPNLHHHLNKMVEIGLLQSVTRDKNGHKLQYYSAKSEMILLVPEKYYDKAVKSKTLKNAFKTVFKFTVVGLFLVSSYFLSDELFNLEYVQLEIKSSPIHLNSLIITLSILCAILIFDRMKVFSNIKMRFNKYRTTL